MAMLSPAQIRGAYTALVTPFTADGSQVDLDAFSALVEAQIAGGISGLVPCGTTGESPTLSDAEQITVIRRTVEVANKRVPVMAGTGSFSTERTIASSKAAIEAGADGVMIVMPYYNKPTQAGMVAHVLSVAAAIPKAPIILYNIPGRSVVDLGVEATAEIFERAKNVVAIKDASGNVLRCQHVLNRLGDDRVAILSGDDALTLPMMASGAKGVISVASNLYPDKVSEVTKLMLEGSLEEARKKHLALLPVFDAMFIESNPSPIKAALSHRGRMNGSVRGPLVPVSESARKLIIETIAAFEAKA